MCFSLDCYTFHIIILTVQMEIRQLMVEYFERPEVGRLLTDYIATHNLNYESLNDDQLMEILDELQILEPLLEQMSGQDNKQAYEQQLQQFESSTSLKNLKVWVQRGRRFREWKTNPHGQKFFISIAGMGNKFRTNSQNIAESFSVGESSVFAIEASELKTTNPQMLELAVVIMTRQGTRRVYAIKQVQWRYVLAHATISFDIQLAPYYNQGVEKMQAVGILSLKLQLYPVSKLNMVQPTAVERQIELQLKMREKHNNQFYSYANNFWNQYKQVHRSFQARRISIYADSEDKIFIPLCRFVCPLYNVRGIDSPQHALRFCSLIAFEEERMNRQTLLKRFHSIIAGMQGTIDDHCNLLCSLLLGFGLKAYVCLGYNYKGEHSWVISEDSKKGSITFWQCTRGAKYDYFSPKTYQIYKAIHVVYNHNQFYANLQLDDSVAGTKFKFKDSALWKSIDSSFLDNIPQYNRQISLSSPTFDPIKIQTNLENAICDRILEYRKLNKLGFNRDPILASILSTALANYEVEKVTGLTFCEDEFESAIKTYIPPKHTFKAFPIQLTTLEPDQIMEALKNQVKCRQILLTKGDSLYFGVRAKLVLYPDNIFALWLSLAVRFYKVG